MTVRHRTILADGRELFYYDRATGTPHNQPDRRGHLTVVTTASQLRWDPLMQEYAVIAGHRQTRTHQPPAEHCPLDPSNHDNKTEIPSDYDVAVLENRFPAFTLAGAAPTPSSADFVAQPARGRCEVVCFTSDHGGSFSDLSPSQARTVIDAWVDRTRSLSAVPTIHYVLCFENRGEQIGVTLSHPHGQIYGYPFLPTRFATMGESFDTHLRRTRHCLQCDLTRAELRDGPRVVLESQHWVAYVPFAAKWPYQLRLVPRAHRPDLPALTDEEMQDLARNYPRLLGAFDELFQTGPTPYIASWQQAPIRAHRESWHLAAEIITIRRAENKLKYLAGSESAAGVWINDIEPEQAADVLRRALTRLPDRSPVTPRKQRPA